MEINDVEKKEYNKKENTPRGIIVYASNHDTARLVLYYFWNSVHPNPICEGTTDDPLSYDYKSREIRWDPDRTYTPQAETTFFNPKTGKKENAWAVEFSGNHHDLTPEATEYILSQFSYYPMRIKYINEDVPDRDEEFMIIDGEKLSIQNK